MTHRVPGPRGVELWPAMSHSHVFAGSRLDRAAHLRRDEAALEALQKAPGSRLLPLWRLRGLIALEPAPALAWQPMARLEEFAGEGKELIFLGLDEAGAGCFAVGLEFSDNPAKGGVLDGAGKFIDVRTIAPQLGYGDAAILAQARSLIDWHARHRFCAACGGATEVIDAGTVRQCPAPGCGAQHFPRTDPVVIMIALWQDSCLLGRQPPWPPGRYSALAGFVEPGESIEEATRREIWEEAGVKVGAVHYHSSQPWPFPSSLMIGCVAEAESPDITLGADELEEARWFSRDEVREMVRRAIEEPDSPELALPPPLSIAFQMSNWWIEAGAATGGFL